MAAALQRDQDPANGWQLLQTYESQRVDDWIKWHSEPQFKTDLWFLVTDENGKETRVPACRTVLSINSVFIQNLPAGDEEIEVKIDRTICTDAITVVYFLWLNYPCFTKKVRSIYSELEYIAASPFDGLVDEVLDETIGYDERQTAELCLAIAKIAKLADFMCAAGTIERLVDIFEKIFFSCRMVRRRNIYTWPHSRWMMLTAEIEELRGFDRARVSSRSSRHASSA